MRQPFQVLMRFSSNLLGDSTILEKDLQLSSWFSEIYLPAAFRHAKVVEEYSRRSEDSCQSFSENWGLSCQFFSEILRISEKYLYLKQRFSENC
jgi:hypothetical protein